ncbi:MAG: RHS repeat-associated core domain-containing protein [Phycisphaerae bacterium]|nr:RHS repeat-associated core domain-containing protein [Phycisphaerae bacterium]
MTAAQYAYDALGRRIGKYDAAAMETTFYYYNDQWQILAAYDEYSSLQRYYVYGNTIDEVLVMNDGADDTYYAHDHLYSPVALLDDDGDVLERYEYDAYGKVQVLTSNFSPLTSSQHGNPYTFTGRQLDILDNGTLHHMHYRHRDYSPQLGRFMQHDPLGLSPSNLFFKNSPLFQMKTGMNVYSYVNNNAINLKDPSGLATCLDNDRYDKLANSSREHFKYLLAASHEAGDACRAAADAALAGCFDDCPHIPVLKQACQAACLGPGGVGWVGAYAACLTAETAADAAAFAWWYLDEMKNFKLATFETDCDFCPEGSIEIDYGDY